MAFPLSGQIVLSGTAQPLSATPVDTTAWSVKAPLTNVNPVFIGPPGVTTSSGHQLDPGDSMEYERSAQNGQPMYPIGPNDCYGVGTANAGDKLTWFASPA